MTSRLTRLGQIWPPVLEANSGPKWWVATTRIPSSVLRVAAHGKRAAFFGRLLRPAEGGLPPILTPVERGQQTYKIYKSKYLKETCLYTDIALFISKNIV